MKTVYGTRCMLKTKKVGSSCDTLVNKPNKMDGLKLLKRLNNGVAAAAFFDPQYRGILDKMGYGNEGVTRGGGALSSLKWMKQ